MKVALCQINPVIGDFDHNLSLMLDAANRAKAMGCRLALFPEMSLIGYPPRDLLEQPAFVQEGLRALDRLCEKAPDLSLVCGYVDTNPGPSGKPLMNCVGLIRKGRLLARGGKRLLPSYDVFDETRFFEPAPGSLVFEDEGLRWGVTVCEDIWSRDESLGVPQYKLDPVSDLAALGLDRLVNLSASPFSVNKGPLRLNILKSLANLYKVPVAYCNQVGGNDDLVFDGSSMVVDPHGRLILLASLFQPHLLVWDTEKTYEEVRHPWPEESASLFQGLVLGTRDYVRKCGFERVLLGLSGGLDSSLVACIAAQALGPDKVTGVSMPSPYTSPLSRECARTQAENLGMVFEEIPIHDLIQTYDKALSPLFQGRRPDVTEENIQARIRGNLLMALSNKFGALLLTTGNKSELAVGYCTLYGDMAGGLAVIGDIPKTACYRLAEYLNREREVIPRAVITRAPSAELRPDQTDQDTLPPYEILDQILEAAVEKRMGLEEIVALGLDAGVVRDVLHRLHTNEYKRLQAPPVLKMTTRAFGYGRRYPIARGRQIY